MIEYRMHQLLIDKGLNSARKTDKNEAQAIWSMAFEDLDPQELEIDHQKKLKQYRYWGK